MNGRKHYLGTSEYFDSNPEKVCVYNSNYDEAGYRYAYEPKPWVVERDGRLLGSYETHHAAMTRAVRLSE